MNSEMTGEQAENVDPVTAVSAAKVGAAAVEDSRKLLQRVLGPGADSIGQFLSQWIEIKFRNALRAAERADAKLAKRGDVEEKPVSLRAAMRILDESSYCGSNDDVTVEYLGGLLASARIAGESNDLANSYAALVSRLSVVHLRLHFAFYTALHHAYQGDSVNVHRADELYAMNCFVPISAIQVLFDAADDSDDDVNHDVNTAMFWLDRESLIGFYEAGPSTNEKYRDQLGDNPPPGIVVSPSVIGLDLFLWGLGYPDSVKSFFQLEPESIEVDSLPVPLSGVVRLRE